MSTAMILDLLILTLIWAGIASAWNLLAGFAGQFSLGHAAFIGVGAYSAALPASYYGVSPWIGLMGGMLIAGVLALVIASVSFRMKGPFFTLLTIAFAEVIRILVTYAKPLTNGSEGIVVYLEYGLWNMTFDSKWPFLAIAALYAVIMCVISIWIRGSRFGHWLLAVREDEDAARSLGVPVYRARLAATVVSAACAAAGGSVLAMYTQFIDPDSTMSFMLSVEPALIAIVGGLGSALGPLVGAILIVPLEKLLRGWFGGVVFGLHGVFFGLLLIGILLLMPEGLLRAITNLHARWVARKNARNK